MNNRFGYVNLGGIYIHLGCVYVAYAPLCNRSCHAADFSRTCKCRREVNGIGQKLVTFNGQLGLS